jgi:hypothetical protein
MHVRFEKIEGEEREFLQQTLLGSWLKGECYALAVALNQGLDWPIVGLMNGKEPYHAAVLSPLGFFWDARGKTTKEEFLGPFSEIGPPCKIELMHSRELFKQRPISEDSIRTASNLAQAIWPELPWRPETLTVRMKKFTEALTNVCRKHKIWLRAPYPTTPPIAYDAYGDEKGYSFKYSGTGQEFFIDRLDE